jgi:hypothetical protein
MDTLVSQPSGRLNDVRRSGYVLDDMWPGLRSGHQQGVGPEGGRVIALAKPNNRWV